MCRIAGIVNSTAETSQLQHWVTQMCELQKHGGPDAGGIFSADENKVVLGNRRLSLQDLSAAGHQPMQFADRYTITYNGELYNFKEIKATLQNLGYQFHSNSDTEVILAAFSEWHTQSFAKFNGMFAFCIWDALEKQIYLVRDASGMKPLYYSVTQNGLAFASEMKAFKAIPYLQTPSANWPIYLLAWGHLPEPITTLKSVVPLHKGCFIRYDVNNATYDLHCYKFYSYTDDIVNVSEIKPKVKLLLNDAVHRHMIADAKIGVFLSGGIDSSIISALSANQQKTAINTFSLYFEEAQFSEKKYQDLMLATIHAHSFQHLMREDEFHTEFPAILNDMDMPCNDGINTWFISKYAKKEGLKAVLSGIGADELFGGYPSFQRINLARKMQRLPDGSLGLGKYIKKKQFNRLSYLRLDGIKGIYLFLRGHYPVQDIAKLIDANESEVWAILNELPATHISKDVESKSSASWMEFNLYMQNQLLRDADVMGMCHSVEIRVPFLDDELISYTNRIAPAIKFSGTQPKHLLIDCFQSELPKEIWDRKKMGFSFPFSEWLKRSEFVADLMRQAGTAVEHNFQKFKAGKLHWSTLMSLIILQHKKAI